MTHLSLKIQCKRCRIAFELGPGEPLAAFCETCRRLIGGRIPQYDQWGLNERLRQIRERNPHDPRRILIDLKQGGGR